MKRKIKIVVNKLSGAITLLTTELLLLQISFFISLSLLIIVIREIFYHKEYTMDERVFGYLSYHVSNNNTLVMQFFSFIGSQLFLVPAWLLMLTFYYFIHKNKWSLVKMVIIALSNLGLMFALKFFFNRPRPLIPLLKEVPGLSFPSGHAFMSLIFFGMLIYLVYREVKNGTLKWIMILTLAIIIFMIGLSRVYLRVHFASDVIAGFCFGVVSLIVLLWMLREIEKFNAKKIPQHLNVTRTGDDVAGIKGNSIIGG